MMRTSGLRGLADRVSSISEWLSRDRSRDVWRVTTTTPFFRAPRHGIVPIITCKEFPLSDLPACPRCGSVYTYLDGVQYVCPECAHEWSPPPAGGEGEAGPVVRDAHGTILNDGDTVVVIKDLKIKGSSAVLKQGTRVKNIRLVAGDHDIDCRIPGIGAMGLKSEFVRKA